MRIFFTFPSSSAPSQNTTLEQKRSLKFHETQPQNFTHKQMSPKETRHIQTIDLPKTLRHKTEPRDRNSTSKPWHPAPIFQNEQHKTTQKLSKKSTSYLNCKGWINFLLNCTPRQTPHTTPDSKLELKPWECSRFDAFKAKRRRPAAQSTRRPTRQQQNAANFGREAGTHLTWRRRRRFHVAPLSRITCKIWIADWRGIVLAIDRLLSLIGSLHERWSLPKRDPNSIDWSTDRRKSRRLRRSNWCAAKDNPWGPSTISRRRSSSFTMLCSKVDDMAPFADEVGGVDERFSSLFGGEVKGRRCVHSHRWSRISEVSSLSATNSCSHDGDRR